MKRVEDLEQAVGMSVLAVIPPVNSSKAIERARVAEKTPHAPASEAFRSLRASLVLRQEWRTCRRLMVTSTTAGEGKSLVASNLAIVLAHDGKRTLLIDGDMRRPTAHRLFEIPASPGLSEVLTGKCAAEQAICATAVDGLSVMSSGREARDPSELLASSMMRNLLETQEKRFDHIIVDSPPVFGVSDPISLLPAMQGVVFVVHYAKTGRRAAVRALGKIREGQVPFIGVVFNNVLLKLSSGYYYYYQYHRYGNEAGSKSV
jgi:capsular exopolysaccharide synthesis family protein